jgi:hypothetical protein
VVSPYVFVASFTAATTNSIQGNGTGGNQLQLVGDSAAPGASRYYGTNGSGTKGFHAITVYDGSETKVQAGTNVTVTGSGTVGSPYVVNATSASPVFASKAQLTAAVNFSFCQVKSTGGTFEVSDKVLKVGHPTDDYLRTITIEAMLHIESTSFSTAQFIHVATIPSGYRPSGLVSFQIASAIPGTGNPATTPIRSTGGTGITNGAVYGLSSAYIDPDTGYVYARLESVSSYGSLSGTPTVLIPISVSYFINAGT